MKGIIPIVHQFAQLDGTEFEFDIDSLPLNACLQLKQYVSQCMAANSEEALAKKPSDSFQIDSVELERIMEAISDNQEPDMGSIDLQQIQNPVHLEIKNVTTKIEREFTRKEFCN